MNHIALKRFAVLGGVAIATCVATLVAVRARAAGIPDPADALTYTGYIENPDGTPLTGKPAIAVNLWADATVADAACTAKLAANTQLQGGRFQVALGKSCADAVNANPMLFVDVEVDGVSLGRTPLGAVPYAMQAGHAADSPAATPWASYAPSLLVNGGNGVAVTGATSKGSWRRIGDSIEVRIFTSFTQTPTTGATLYVWSIPPGLEIDVTKGPNLTPTVGGGMAQTTGNNVGLGIYVRDKTCVAATAFGTGSYYVTDTHPFTWVKDDDMSVYFTVPIVGWTTSKP